MPNFWTIDMLQTRIHGLSWWEDMHRIDYKKGVQYSRVKPNSNTFASIFPACAFVGVWEECLKIPQSIVENNFTSNAKGGNA